MEYLSKLMLLYRGEKQNKTQFIEVETKLVVIL